MSRNAVPPMIDQARTTAIGIGTRELVILGATAFLVLFIIIIPIGIVLKVGFGVIFGGAGVVLAFGRVNRNTTFEKHMMTRFEFTKRSRFFQRGAGYSMPKAQVKVIPEPINKEPVSDTGKTRSKKPALDFGSGGYLFQVEPIDLNVNVFYTILGIAFLGMLLSWLWLGGYQELEMIVRPLL